LTSAVFPSFEENFVLQQKVGAVKMSVFICGSVSSGPSVSVGVQSIIILKNHDPAKIAC
jgi:hypothetical protein